MQIVGLIVDVDSTNSKTYASAEKILNASGVTFRNILVTEEMLPLLYTLIGVPTTFFIDREGHEVHDAVPGAYVESYRQVVEEYLNR